MLAVHNTAPFRLIHANIDVLSACVSFSHLPHDQFASLTTPVAVCVSHFHAAGASMLSMLRSVMHVDMHIRFSRPSFSIMSAAHTRLTRIVSHLTPYATAAHADRKGLQLEGQVAIITGSGQGRTHLTHDTHTHTHTHTDTRSDTVRCIHRTYETCTCSCTCMC